MLNQPKLLATLKKKCNLCTINSTKQQKWKRPNWTKLKI